MRAKLGLRIRVKFNFALILCEAHRLVRFTRERGGCQVILTTPFVFYMSWMRIIPVIK